MGSVTGCGGDKLDLNEPIPMPPTAGCTLLLSEGTLEAVMLQLGESVEKITNDTMASKEELATLAVTAPRQTCCLVQRVRFTKDIDKCSREAAGLNKLHKTYLETRSKLSERQLHREIPEGEQNTLR